MARGAALALALLALLGAAVLAQDLDLADALGDKELKKPVPTPKKPTGDDFNLEDAFDDDPPPSPPKRKPQPGQPENTGGFSDSDLVDGNSGGTGDGHGGGGGGSPRSDGEQGPGSGCGGCRPGRAGRCRVQLHRLPEEEAVLQGQRGARRGGLSQPTQHQRGATGSPDAARQVVAVCAGPCAEPAQSFASQRDSLSPSPGSTW